MGNSATSAKGFGTASLRAIGPRADESDTDHVPGRLRRAGHGQTRSLRVTTSSDGHTPKAVVPTLSAPASAPAQHPGIGAGRDVPAGTAPNGASQPDANR